MSLPSNSQISHYRVLSKLGAGGMGEVYLALDTKLDRKVALKILPADVAANRDRMDRFIREAKSAAALNHPNIAHVYEIGESGGTHFIAMEFIDGETLREKILLHKTPLSKLLKYLNQVAEGLSKAHGAGIVHRDLKPDNVMITRDDYAKVLDFGLAKLIESPGSSGPAGSGSSEVATAMMPQHSTPGMVMGTAGYMSPEQATGRVNEIDHRSDIFSFGCILFEAATGSKAFEGKDALDSLHKIVHGPTPQLKDLNPLAPQDLQRVVRRCLAKEPEKRYQSIKEVAIEIDDLRQELKRSKTNDHSVSAPTLIVTSSGSNRTDEGFWIAVLPFKYRGSNADIEALAEGLSEDIVTGLSRFAYLRVIARSSTLRFASEAADVRSIGKELGARYVLEGTVRQAGPTLRISAQLVETVTGTHLWAETYHRSFEPKDLFALQDELVPRIVSTVADQHGVMIHSMGQELRRKSKDQYTPYEAVLSVFGFHERMTPEEHSELRDVLERVVRDFPNEGDSWAMLETLYCDEHMFGFNVRPDALGRALAAAQRAVELAPSSNLASQALAQALFFRREMTGFRPIAERTIALNPMDGATVAFMGILIACSGDWEHGCAIVESVMNLNPNFPGWYRLPSIWDAYRKRDYRTAADRILRVNLPSYFWTLVMSAAAYAQLGETAAAQRALGELLNVKPDFPATAREELSRWLDTQLVEHVMEGLRKAGLQSVDKGSIHPPADVQAPGITKTIAVLPFQNLSGDPEQEYFADGITEEILNALAQIPGVRVAGRSSAFCFKGRSEDLRSVGAKLGVETILEGTLRKSGDRLRITAQLIDAGNGYQLWSERYDRVLQDVFAVQDEIANTIAGRLQLSLSDWAAGQPAQPPTRDIGAYELYLKGRAFLYQRGLSIPKAIDCFKQAVSLDPAYAQAWAGLADGYTTSGFSGLKRAVDVMPNALEAARRSLVLDPDLAEAHNALACATLLYEWNFDLAEREFQRALELNPNYPQARAWYGLFFLQWVAGRIPEAHAQLAHLLQIDPLSAYAHAIVSISFLSSDRIPEAVEHGRRAVELDPNSYLAHYGLAVSLRQNGQYEDATAIAERALTLSGRHNWALTALVTIYAACGKPDNARAVYSELQSRREREYIQPALLATAADAVGEVDQALEIAQQALAEKDPMFVMLPRGWPDYSRLRTEPRFRDIVSQLRLPGWSVTAG